jgi:hypothetical protein
VVGTYSSHGIPVDTAVRLRPTLSGIRPNLTPLRRMRSVADSARPVVEIIRWAADRWEPVSFVVYNPNFWMLKGAAAKWEPVPNFHPKRPYNLVEGSVGSMNIQATEITSLCN